MSATDPTPSTPRVLPVMGNLDEPLDDLALARWNGALSSGTGHLLSNFQLDASDLPTLRDGKWLSSEILDCFAELLNATQAPEKSVTSPGIHMFSVHLYAFLATKEYNYSNVSRWVRNAKIDWPSTSHILVPAHVNKNHFILVDVDVKSAKVVMFDSRQRSRWDREQVLGNVRRMVQDALDARDISTWGLRHNVLDWKLVCEPTAIPQQKDGSCGVFVCGFAACLAAKVPFLFGHADVPSLRKRIGLAILDGSPRRCRSRRVTAHHIGEGNKAEVTAAVALTDLPLTLSTSDATVAVSKPDVVPTKARANEYNAYDVVWFYTLRLPTMNPWLSMTGQSIRGYVFRKHVCPTDATVPTATVHAPEPSRRISHIPYRSPQKPTAKPTLPMNATAKRQLARPTSKTPAPDAKVPPKPTSSRTSVPDDPPPPLDPPDTRPSPRHRQQHPRRAPAFVLSLRRTAEAAGQAGSAARARSEPLPPLDVLFTTHVPVLSHVPRGARTQVRDALSNVLREFNFAKSEQKACGALTKLFAFAPCLLAAPLGHRRDSTSGKVPLTTIVKERVKLWNDRAYGQLWRAVSEGVTHRSAQKLTAEQQQKSNVARAIRLAKEGAYSRAAQALGSEGVHAASPAVAAELRRKHPQEQPDTDGDFPFPPDAELPPIPDHHKFTSGEVMEAVQSFPKAVAAGGSAFSATHLLELLRVPTTQRFSLLDALTDTVNTLARGKAPVSMSQWISSAPITPLRKRDGGVRPIAVGETLRRLVGKLWMKRIKPKAQSHLGDSQVGVAVKGGTEAVVHAVQGVATQFGNDRSDMAVLQLDLANAFNLVSRRAFLRVVRTEFPELFPWVNYTYGCNKPWLWYGRIRWRSATGVQQGDPLGPLLFALALRALMDDLEPKLKQWDRESGGDGVLMRVFYCDDGVFVAKHGILRKVLNYFAAPFAKSYGFHLRVDKCHVWWPCAPSSADQAGYPGEVIQEYCMGTRVLQAPVGDLASVESMVVSQVQEAGSLLDAIADLPDAHVAFYLLRACFGSCRLAYTLRCVPPEASLRAAEMYDTALENTLRRMIGGVLPSNVFRELQLPVKHPAPSFGVGLLSAASTASSAYIASRMSTVQLVQQLIPHGASPHPLNDVLFEGAYRDYARRCGPDGAPALCEIGSSRAEPQNRMVARVHKEVLRSIDKGDMRTQLFRSQLGLPGAKDWLKCAPAPGLRTHIPDRDFRVWFRYWCRIPLFNPGDRCPRSGCNRELDDFGDHLLGCTRGISKGNAPILWRHDAVTRLLHSDLSNSKRRPILERRDGAAHKSRPDIQCLGTSGGTDFLEVSITNPLPGRAKTTKSLLDSPARVLEDVNRIKCRQHADTITKVPDSQLIVVSVTTLCGWSKSARRYVKEVIKSQASYSMDEYQFATQTAFARYAARLLSANVHCLTEGVSTSSQPTEA